MKPSDEKNYEEMIKKNNFEKTFREEIRKEKSYLGKLLLQENHIFYMVFKLLNTVGAIIDMSDNSLKSEHLFKMKKMGINKTPNKEELFEDYTLGRLIGLLKIFIEKNNSISGDLDDYNTGRNKLTHKMFDEYDDIKPIKEDAKRLVISGDKILDKIEPLNLKYIDNIRNLRKSERKKK